MEHNTIRKEDIHYEYDTRGYMIYYKNKPICGAGIDKYAKGCRDNLKLFRDCAEATKRQILAGYIDGYMKDRIREIDKEMETESNNEF